MSTTHKAPSEKAFSYALTLSQQLSKLQGRTAGETAELLLNLAGMSAAEVSKTIDYCQQQIKSYGAKTATFVPATLAYVPPAGQYVVDGVHYTLKVSKSHGGTLVYVANGYLGSLAAPKCAALASALDTAEKAQAACIAYSKVTGKCGVCNTTLKDPKSIADGIGPVCAKKYA